MYAECMQSEKTIQNISAIIVIIKLKSCLGFSREPRGILYGLVSVFVCDKEGGAYYHASQ